MTFPYDAANGVMYARLYALYALVPEKMRLFFYDRNGSDCTNFVSQCVWAAYGGWLPGIEPENIERNRERIRQHIRFAPFVWYGSPTFTGSNAWCRVVEFFDYCLQPKANGPKAVKIGEGDWSDIKPSLLKEGDVIQLVVSSYAAYRYGHCLYVTREGTTWDSVQICCHSIDRMDSPLSEFAYAPKEYPKLRVIRFKDTSFIK